MQNNYDDHIGPINSKETHRHTKKRTNNSNTPPTTCVTTSLDEFIIELEKEIRLNPEDHQLRIKIGYLYRQSGRPKEAARAFQEAISIDPDNAEPHCQLGNISKESGQKSDATNHYKKALRLNPQLAEAIGNLANIYMEDGIPEASIPLLQKAVELLPAHPVSHNNLALAYQQTGHLEKAIASLEKALKLQPDYAPSLNNLGIIYVEQNKLDQAINLYRNCLTVQPKNPDFLNNLGLALKAKGDIPASIIIFSEALSIHPNSLEINNNAAQTLVENGDTEFAIYYYKKALSISPGSPAILTNLAMCELLMGDYANGLEHYENRHSAGNGLNTLLTNPRLPRGHINDADRSSKLILVSEQGLGDTLQFMRYAKILREKGIPFSICAESKLHSLIKASDLDPLPLTADEVDELESGTWLPLLSILKQLEVNPHNPIVSEPYIKTTDALIEKWKKALSSETHPIIGINWQGNPAHEKTNSRGRSLPLQAFETFATQANVSLLSLQKGHGSDQLEACNFREKFVKCQDQINKTWDFLETAAIIKNCDLVITSDTSVAHLSAGLGQETWLLLKDIPEWRWGLSGSESFWYPTMRLFRQRTRGNWNEVIDSMTQTFLERVSNRTEPDVPAPTPTEQP